METRSKLPHINVVFNRRKTATLTRKASVEIRITYDYQQKYLSTGIMLYSNQWKNGNIVNCPDILEISQSLTRQVTKVRQVLLDMMEKGTIDIMSIQEKLKSQNHPRLSFIAFCRQRAEVRKYGRTSDSQMRYDRFLKIFERWGVIKDFEDIGDSSIIAFDRYLAQKKLRPYSKWNNYHRFLNSFIIDAVNAGHMTRNPYKWVNIDKGKDYDSLNKCLTPKEFNRFKNAKMPTESTRKIRDVFVFQTYTCMSYTDLKKFNPKDIEEVNGMMVYVGNRQKTGQQFTIPILPPAWEILKRYKMRLPIISNVKYNEYLKVAAQAAKIDKPVSTHWARHTGATLLLNNGIDMKIVSKICGHSSTRITERIYAKMMDETVVNAVKAMNDKY